MSMAINWEAIGLEAAERLVVAGAKFILSRGKDPRALLDAELDAADAAAIAEIQATPDSSPEDP